MSFGNILDQPINEIWRQPDYKHFRRAFATPDLPAMCRKCYKGRMQTIERQAETEAHGLVPEF